RHAHHHRDDQPLDRRRAADASSPHCASTLQVSRHASACVIRGTSVYFMIHSPEPRMIYGEIAVESRRMRGIAANEDERPFRPTRRFEVVRRIGAGGMGIVYELVDRELGTGVAAKTLQRLSHD